MIRYYYSRFRMAMIWLKASAFERQKNYKEAFAQVKEMEKLGKLPYYIEIYKGDFLYALKNYYEAAKQYDLCWDILLSINLTQDNKNYLLYYTGFFGDEAARISKFKLKNIKEINKIELNLKHVDMRWKRTFPLPKEKKSLNMLLVPNMSVGPFHIGDDINKYIKSFNLKSTLKIDEALNEKSFMFVEKDILINTNQEKISSITCYKECIYNNINLIGLSYSELIDIFGQEADEIGEANDTEDNESTEFAALFQIISVVVFFKESDKIVTSVQCFNYENEEELLETE